MQEADDEKINWPSLVIPKTSPDKPQDVVHTTTSTTDRKQRDNNRVLSAQRQVPAEINAGQTQQFRHKHLHSRKLVSELQILDIDRLYPRISEALNELPIKLCRPSANGIFMQRRFYQSQWRNPNYLANFLRRRADFVDRFKRGMHLSPLTCEMLRIVARNLGFLTYDKLLEQLKSYKEPAWVSMKTEDLERIDAYPTISEEELARQRLAEADESTRKAIEDISRELGYSTPENLVSVRVRFGCRYDGTVETEGYVDQRNPDKRFARCPICKKVFHLGRSDIIS